MRRAPVQHRSEDGSCAGTIVRGRAREFGPWPMRTSMRRRRPPAEAPMAARTVLLAAVWMSFRFRTRTPRSTTRCRRAARTRRGSIKRRTHSLFRQGCFWYSAIPAMREDRFELLMNANGKLVAGQPAIVEVFGAISGDPSGKERQLSEAAREGSPEGSQSRWASRGVRWARDRGSPRPRP